MLYRGLCWLLLAFVCFSCLCSPIFAAELPLDNGDYIPEGFEAVVDESGLAELPEPVITPPSRDGISLFASSQAIGWRQMIIYAPQGNANVTSYSFRMPFNDVLVQEYANKNLVPGYSYSMPWKVKTSITSAYYLNAVYGGVFTEPFTLSSGAELSGKGFSVYLQAVGLNGRYAPQGGSWGHINTRFTIALVDDTGSIVKLIENKTGMGSSSSFNSGDSPNIATPFPDFQFSADQDYENVRLALLTCGYNADTATVTGLFALRVSTSLISESSAVYLKTSVVEPNGAGQDETSGLLAGIIEWLNKIWNAILSIPSAIVNLGVTILNGIKDLFIPSGEEIGALYTEFTEWLDSNFPLLMLPITLVTWVVNFISAVEPSTAVLSFPEISWMGHTLIPTTAFDFGQIAGLEMLLPWIRFFSTLAVLWAFGHWVKRRIHGYWSDGGDAE